MCLTNLYTVLKKHADKLLGTLYYGHAHVPRWVKLDNPSQNKVIQGAIVTKNALMHEIQQIYKQTQMYHLKYTSLGIPARPRVTQYGQLA